MSLTVEASKAPSSPAASPPVAATTQPSAAASVFSPDLPGGPDHLARGADAAYLAELALHKTAGTPLCIGLFGVSGSGKSAFLDATLASVERLAAAAEEAGIATPFLGNAIAIKAKVQPGRAPATALMRQIHAALAVTHPRLAAEASAAGLDPRAAARDAGERLNEARQRLDTERRSLDDLSGRQARLPETVLFDTAGSRVDAYARTNRARIDRSLRRFGFAGDTTATFKEMVRDASEPGGALAQKSGWMRAFWAYRGQTRLIVIAFVFFAISWALGALIGNEAAVINAVRSGNEKLGATADWMTDHADWLGVLKQVVEIAGVVALAMNVIRGVRFLQPVIKGASLLRGDVEGRRRDIDSLVAHQTQRVDTLAREADLAAQHAAEAEARLTAGGNTGAPAALTVAGVADADGTDAARMFFETLATAMAATANDRLPTSAAAAPSRIVIGLDGFDQATSDAAAAMLHTARGLLDAPGFVTVVAADRHHLVAGLAETDPALAATQLNRLVQIPYAIGDDGGAWGDAGRFAQALLAGASPVKAAPAAPDATHSALDMPWLQSERAVLEALAPTAGTTPRAVKRFVNLYRVARADPRMRGGTAQDLAALAIALALQTGGSPVDARALAKPSAFGAMDEEVQAARKAASEALGAPLTLQPGNRGLETARGYDARG